VAVPIRVIAFAVGSGVLFVGHIVAVQAMRSRE
jgi:hypothetical protein